MTTKTRAPRVTKTAVKAPKRERIADDDHGDSATAFWAGRFGTAYTARNQVKWQERIPLLRRMAEQTGAASFRDVGCNAGWNLRALKAINADFAMSGVDINHNALQLASEAGFDVINAAATDVVDLFGSGSAELVITSGVLIHIPTDTLVATMQAIRDVSSRYVLAIEYASEREVAVDYRGHADRLWKRPYGELYQSMSLALVESGPAEGYNDCHYWLLEKVS